jgi:hypothetical protein
MITQAQVNERIDHHIELAEFHLDRRDREPYESPAYWAAHDLAMGQFRIAEMMMPKGSSSFGPFPNGHPRW